MKRVFIFWTILFLPAAFLAQIQNKETQWTRIESPRGDLSFAVPTDFLIDNEEKEHHRVIAYQNQVNMRVDTQDDANAKSRLKSMHKFPANGDPKISHFTLGDFIGDVYTFEKENSFAMSFYIASSKAFHTLTVSSENSKNPVLVNFLYSIKLDNQPLIKQETQANQKEETKISITSLKTSPIILEALKKKDAEKTKIKYELDNKEIPEDVTKYSRSLIILRKPRPSYTDGARQNGVQGTVKLKVMFQANGEIGDITVLSKLKSGLSENAANVARRIKFLPAEIDGKPVDVSRVVEYTFTIY